MEATSPGLLWYSPGGKRVSRKIPACALRQADPRQYLRRFVQKKQPGIEGRGCFFPDFLRLSQGFFRISRHHQYAAVFFAPGIFPDAQYRCTARGSTPRFNAASLTERKILLRAFQSSIRQALLRLARPAGLPRIPSGRLLRFPSSGAGVSSSSSG